MTDYNSLKVPELKKILGERSLAVSGNKAELVTRLQENDTEKASAPAATISAAAATIAPPAEDEIDWDDEPAAKPTEPGAAAIAAGGQGQVTNPAAVPNQKVADDPATLTDLGADAVVNTATGEATEKAEVAATEAPKPTAEEIAAKKEEEAAKYRAGLAATSLEAELEKRKARAKRFGLPEETDAEAIKALERAKRFGTGDAGIEQKAVKGLDMELPTRPVRGEKRGRDGQRGRGDQKRARTNDRGGRREGGDRNGGRKEGVPKTGGGRITDDPAEKAKAAARAARFAATA
jgi:SAP domain-containing ribonucleoprotein